MPFSVPFNQDFEEFIPLVVKPHFRSIEEIYFPLPSNLVSNARELQANESLDQYRSFLAEIREYGIRPVAAINGAFTGPETYVSTSLDSIASVLSELRIDKVTIRNSYLTKLLSATIPGLELEASINCGYDSLAKLEVAINEFPYKSIVIDRGFNRDLKGLSRVSELLQSRNISRKILVNEGCVANCPYKLDHDLLISICSYANPDFQKYIDSFLEKHSEYRFLCGNMTMHLACGKIYKEEPWRLLDSPFIRPEDLDRYVPYADIFKIAGRTQKSKRIAKILNAYITRSYEGDIYKYLENGGIDPIKPNLPNKELSFKILGLSTSVKKDWYLSRNKEI